MFNWKDSYSFGIPDIDDQHRKLFEIGSRLSYTAMLQDDYDHYDEIMQILKELTDYTEYHFSSEEEILRQYGYDGYDAQVIEHSFFVKRLKKISGKDFENHQNEALMEILNFLSDWIGGHILESDKKYVGFLKEAGAGGNK
jgi:hemerythrin